MCCLIWNRGISAYHQYIFELNDLSSNIKIGMNFGAMSSKRDINVQDSDIRMHRIRRGLY